MLHFFAAPRSALVDGRMDIGEVKVEEAILPRGKVRCIDSRFDILRRLPTLRFSFLMDDIDAFKRELFYYYYFDIDPVRNSMLR